MADLLRSEPPANLKTPQLFTIGVLSDTHVPDRQRRLDPRILQAFEQAGVELILHAGDISTRGVLEELEQVAPVQAVRGNRDWMMLPDLPSSRQMEIHGVSLALAHGHGSLLDYIRDRLYYYANGFQIERYLPRLKSSFPATRIIIFGHIHRPHNRIIDGQLLFNPGSAHVPDPPYNPSAGILQISSQGEVQARIIHLNDVPTASPQSKPGGIRHYFG